MALRSVRVPSPRSTQLVSTGMATGRVESGAKPGENLPGVAPPVGIEEPHYVGSPTEVPEAFADILLSLYHDVLSPANLAMAYAETMLSQVGQMSPQEQERCIKGIVRSLGRLNRLVRNILCSSRLSSEPIYLDWQKVKLHKVIGSLVREYRNLYGAKRIRTCLEPALPPVPGDPVGLEQVVANLLDNALKYSPADTTATVGAKHLAALDLNMASGVPAELIPGVLVWVHNQADGFMTADLENLFEQFRRGSNHSITSGHGLGLYVCLSIVGAHGGKIWVNNDPQKGITFAFCLPLAGAPRQLQFKEMSLPGH